jgi:predicted MFS family arabinose efflux permease
LIGWVFGRQVPPAPPLQDPQKLDWNVFTASTRLIRGTLRIKRLFLAIIAISFFWTIGAILFIQFPPLVKNALTSDKAVASVFLAIFSIGVAIGSLAVNRLLKGEVSARYSPVAVILMGLCVFAFYYLSKTWEHAPAGTLYNVGDFLAHPGAIWLSVSLLGIAIFGGVFVVPLYAFLTTTVQKSEAARTVAANNIVNAGCMTLGALATMAITNAGVSAADQLLMAAGMCLVAAWLAWVLHRACEHPLDMQGVATQASTEPDAPPVGGLGH